MGTLKSGNYDWLLAIHGRARFLRKAKNLNGVAAVFTQAREDRLVAREFVVVQVSWQVLAPVRGRREQPRYL